MFKDDQSLWEDSNINLIFQKKDFVFIYFPDTWHTGQFPISEFHVLVHGKTITHALILYIVIERRIVSAFWCSFFLSKFDCKQYDNVLSFNDSSDANNLQGYFVFSFDLFIFNVKFQTCLSNVFREKMLHMNIYAFAKSWHIFVRVRWI